MPQVSLRFPEHGDAGALAEAVRESFAELHRWMSWCHPGYAEADALQWISEQGRAREVGTAFEFLIIGTEGRTLGTCGINRIDAPNRVANLGYWVRTSETRRGIAAEAARLVANWAFENTTLERLEIVTAVGNGASQRVAEKVGALSEGKLRSRVCIHGSSHDAYMHSLIRPRQPTP